MVSSVKSFIAELMCHDVLSVVCPKTDAGLKREGYSGSLVKGKRNYIIVKSSIIRYFFKKIDSAPSANRYRPMVEKIGCAFVAYALASACLGDEKEQRDLTKSRDWIANNIGQVRVATGKYRPYYGKNLIEGGPVTANIRFACKRAKLNCIFEFVEWDQVPIWLEAEKIDFTYTYSKTEDRLKKYVFSNEPVTTAGNTSIFYRKSAFPNGIHFREHKDLVGCAMLGSPGSWYAADFKELGVKTKWEYVIPWLALGSGKEGVEAYLTDTYVGLEELRLLDRESGDLIRDIAFSRQDSSGIEEEPGRLMFQKKHFDERKEFIRDALDKTFKKLNITNTIEMTMTREYAATKREVISDKNILGCDARTTDDMPLIQQ